MIAPQHKQRMVLPVQPLHQPIAFVPSQEAAFHVAEDDDMKLIQFFLGGEVFHRRAVRVRCFAAHMGPQLDVRVAGMTIVIRGQRPGEHPATTKPMQHFDGYSSHDEWGTDHFGFTYRGDLRAFCAELKRKADDRFGAATSQLAIANVLRSQGNLAEALSTLREALSEIESQRSQLASPNLRMSFFAQVQSFYENCIDLLMQMHHDAPKVGYDREAFLQWMDAQPGGGEDLVT